MKSKKLAIAGISGALLLGAGSGLIMSMPGSVSAASSSVSAITTGSTATVAADTADSARPTPGARLAATLQTLVDAGTITADQSLALVAAVTAAHDAAETAGIAHERGALLTDSLAAMVAAGTIDQAQSDAITAAVEAARPQGGRGGHGGHGGPGGGRHGGQRGMKLDVTATALGMTAAELKVELDAGKTIADVATAKGVNVQTVIDALVADQTANIVERVTNMVNGVKPAAPVADTTATTDTATTAG